MNSNGYLEKIKTIQFSYDPYLSSSSLSIIDASPTYSLSIEANPTLSSNSFAFTSVCTTSSSISTSTVSTLDSDISYNCGDIISKNLYTNLTTDIAIDLSCSISGSTTISYSLQAISPSSIPSWITLDQTNRKIIVNTNNVLPGTIVTFQIISASSDSPRICNKRVNLEVIACNVSNCSTCSSGSPNICITCVSGYSLSQDSSTGSSSCIKNNYKSSGDGASTSTTSSTSNSKIDESSVSSSTSEKASVATQSMVGAAAGATMAFSFCNLSTPQGIWISLNQFQLILLLLLTNSHIPKSIVDYLSGLKATTCSLNFIPFKDIPGFKELVDSLEQNLEFTNLEYFGIKSGSTFSNNFSLICVVIIISLIHLCYLLIAKRLKKCVSGKENCMKILDKIYQLFAFTIYLRLFLEANQFLMLSCLSELKLWNPLSASKLISLCIAFLATILCIFLIVISFLNWMFNKNLESTDHYFPLKELFGGLKDNSKPRLYSTILLTRRAFLVIFLVMGSSLTSITIIVPMMVVQFIYLSLIILIRPYKSAKDNILEITNEVFYFILISLLVHFNSESRWNKQSETAYLCLIIVNSLAVISIMLTSIIIKLIQKCIVKCKGNKTKPKTSNTVQAKNRTFKISELENAEFSPAFSVARPSSKINSVDLTSELQVSAVKHYHSKKKRIEEESKSPFSVKESDAERYWRNYSNV